MKFLITADWHINNYKTYNAEFEFRLLQFPRLARRTIELAKQHGIKDLVIAGDFIDIPVLPPRTQHVVKDVIDTLKSYFEKIYYILGQHDLDTKGDLNKEDTLLTLFDDDKFIYSNHKIIEVDGVRIGFQDWSVGQDTSWIDGKLDVLIGHFTKSSLFGQEIDESKFDLMIHGDIHNTQVIGKFVSICTPIQKDMSSEAAGTMIIYDTELREWERIMVDEPHERFLRIVKTRNPDEEGFASPILYKIFSPVEVNASGEEYEIPIPEWSEIDELVKGLFKNYDLIDIHNEILAKCQFSDEVDFNFRMKYLDIENYRSIEKMHLDFTGEDIILLLGSNGSGKSSVISALQHLFYYDTHLQDNASCFEDGDRQVQLEYGLYYQDKFYKIRKGAEWGLEIDGVEVGFNSKPKFEKGLPEYLPFLNYPDVFFISSTISDLTGNYSPERRSELLSKFFKFDRVLDYSATAADLRNETQIQYGEVESKISEVDAVINFINQNLEKYEGEDEDDLDILLLERDRLERKDKLAKQYDTWKAQLDVAQAKIDAQNHTIELLKSETFGDIPEMDKAIEELTKKQEDLNSKLAQVSHDYDEFRRVKEDLKISTDNKKTIEDELVAIESNKCPTCGQVMVSDKQKELLDKYKDRYQIIQQEYKVKREKYKKLCPLKEDGTVDKMYYKVQINDINSELNAVRIELNDFLSIKKRAEDSSKRISDATNILSEYQNKVNDLMKSSIPKTEFTLSDSNNLTKVKLSITRLEKVKELKSQLKEKEDARKLLKDSIAPLELRMERLYNYMVNTSTTGAIYEEILTKIAKSFNSERIRWIIDSGVYRNKDYLIFNAEMKVEGFWRPYDTLSSGQKNIVDLDFLSKMLATRTGLLALDEMLKHLDENNSIEASELLTKMNVNTLIVATHSIGFPDYTQKLNLQLNNEGRTQFMY